ncbi:MAG: hypothetical protein ACWGPS_03400, partial [Candidatus Promineifilaceae bacterium]
MYPVVSDAPKQQHPSASGPVIHSITTNAATYAGGQIPRYERFEISFQVDTAAQNLQLPFDPSPPAGIEPEMGISVDALFTPDNWRTTYTQPAFYYQSFTDEVKSGQEWFYPTEELQWKVRFSPNQTGLWQFRLIARDSTGVSETAPQSFTVTLDDRKGFIRVSQADPRYFAFDDGSYFAGLGYNMNYDHVSWYNPVEDNEPQFQLMDTNGIQLVRIWLSQWGIYGPSWNPWNSIDPTQHGAYVPFEGLSFEEAYGQNDLSMKVDAQENPCMFIGAWKSRPAVKRNTDYRVRIRFKTTNVTGPRVVGYPYGLVAKTGGWLWGDGNNCFETDTGTAVTPHQSDSTAGWQILEGTLNTGNNDFLPLFYLVMENVEQGAAFVDYVWIEEDLGNGQYGANIVSKPWMAHHLYMEQRNSYAFDKLLDLVKQYDIYLKVVISEKKDWIFNHIDYAGSPIPDDPRCDDSDPSNDPGECPGNDWFYGDFRRTTKVRWLQRAWWRYLQARWGYSTNIHSWELLNEGDPYSTRHYALADEFGSYMHQFVPNDHLVTTSFWHSFPSNAFWANPEYPNVDYADYHRYIPQDDANYGDAAQATYDISTELGADGPYDTGKPLIRGETGFVDAATEPPADQLKQDTAGVWLHNFIWGGINSGGMIESYWYENSHIYSLN